MSHSTHSQWYTRRNDKYGQDGIQSETPAIIDIDEDTNLDFDAEYWDSFTEDYEEVDELGEWWLDDEDDQEVVEPTKQDIIDNIIQITVDLQSQTQAELEAMELFSGRQDWVRYNRSSARMAFCQVMIPVLMDAITQKGVK